MKTKIILVIAATLVAAGIWASPPDWQPIQGTQYSMVLIASASIDDVEFTGDGANMFAAFGPGGESDCRGLATWYSNGFWYFTIVGNENDQTIEFKMYNESTDEIVECAQTINFENNSIIGSPAEPFQITSGSSNGTINGSVNLINTHSEAIDPTTVTVYANGFSTHPNSSGNFSFTLPAGNYNLSATVVGYSSNPVENIALTNGQVVDNIEINLIDWEKINGTQYSLTVMAELSMNGEIIENNSSNFLAAFGPNGYDDCRAIATWEPANPPYWEGYWFMTIVGNTNGDEINFIYYDEEENNCAEVINFADNAVFGSPTTPFQLSAGFIDQTFNLTEDWNWISFYLIPENNSLNSIFSSVSENIYQIKNQTQSATYYPNLNSWVGDLNYISPGEAYLVNMINSDILTVTGEAIDPSTPISLDDSWNWIAYYPQYSQSVNNAFSSILDNILQVKSQSQSAFYYNPPGSWVGDLDILHPNSGYKIKMNAADELVYSGSRNIASDLDIEKNQNRDVPNWELISGTEYSMIVMIQAYLDNIEFDNSGNNMVGIFGPGGETDCRGIAVWQEPTGIDGFWYITVVGNVNDEDLTIKIYDSESDQIYENSEILTFEDNTTIGTIQDPFVTNFFTTNVSENSLPEPNFQLFPNPFILSNSRNNLNLKFSPKSVDDNSFIEIYNIKGQKVRVLDLQESNISAGSIIWDGYNSNNNPVSSGVYFIRLQSGEKVISTKRCMIIK